MGGVYTHRTTQHEGRSFLANPPGNMHFDETNGVWMFPGETIPTDPRERMEFIESRNRGVYSPRPADVSSRELERLAMEYAIHRAVHPDFFGLDPDENLDYDNSPTPEGYYPHGPVA